MPQQTAIHSDRRPRELRRRVMFRARMRVMSGWSDACILNVSSRGLMINAPSALAAQGSTVELWHGDRVIVATVVWRKGCRAGLQAEDRVPVDEILAISQSPALQLTAGSWPDVDRRKNSRRHGDSRVRARAMEFVGIAVVSCCLAASAFILVEQAFGGPLRHVQAALSR